jgi:O-antigen ligase
VSKGDLAGIAWPRALLSAACLLAATNGPAVSFSVYVLKRPFLFEDWPFALPINLVVVVGIVRLTIAVHERRWPPTRWSALTLAAFPVWLVVANLIADAPVASMERGLLTAGICAFGIPFALDPLREQIAAIFLAAHAATVTSAALVVLKPRIGRSSIDEFGNGDYFQGIFANRNSLGPACALALIGAVAVVASARSLPIRVGVGALGCLDIWLLIGSRSATPVLGLAASAGVVTGALMWRRWHATAPRRVWAGFAGAIVAVVVWQASLLSLLNRNSGLSDRTAIWADVAQITRNRPLAGYGFWAFWDSEQAWSVYQQFGGFQFGSAHNSLFETALGSGWVGAATFLAVAICAATRSVALVSRSVAGGLWWCAVTALVLAEHTTESFVLYYSYLLILLFAAAALPLRSDAGTNDSHGANATEPAHQDGDGSRVVAQPVASSREQAELG